VKSKKLLRTQIEFDAHLVGIIEPDKFPLSVAVYLDSTIGNSRPVELLLNQLQFFKSTYAKSQMVQTDLFLFIRTRMMLNATSKKYARTADLIHDAVVASVSRLSKKRGVEALSFSQIGNTIDQMVDKLRIDHEISAVDFQQFDFKRPALNYTKQLMNCISRPLVMASAVKHLGGVRKKVGHGFERLHRAFGTAWQIDDQRFATHASSSA
jgi:hypothetical protein